MKRQPRPRKIVIHLNGQHSRQMGDAVRLMRKGDGQTQMELGLEVGHKNQSRVSAIERGVSTKKGMTLGTLIALAKACRRSVVVILELTEPE